MLKIKVCGMRQLPNIKALETLKPDIMGFIFFPGSKRYVGADFRVPDLKNIQKAGVFVDEQTENIKEIVIKNKLDLVQLHGNESPKLCCELASAGIKIIKAISIGNSVDWPSIEAYLPYCQYLLFDTKSENHGGSGRKFNWDLLQSYPFSTPYFIGGGIGIDDIHAINKHSNHHFAGVDINSSFELEPGLKDIESIKHFIKTLRNETI
ncbi:MAG TPA: phosphoribosylanthranilate isomerase [Bacteroidales bacterium]|nr:phosphoribosylanthranilate isomerase [Bacteroidales bacterium]